jgi:peptidyl-dipeptidase Dcp
MLTILLQQKSKKRHEGQYLIGLQNTTQQPILQNLSNRKQEKNIQSVLDSGSKNDDGDTREVLEQIDCVCKKPI